MRYLVICERFNVKYDNLKDAVDSFNVSNDPDLELLDCDSDKVTANVILASKKDNEIHFIPDFDKDILKSFSKDSFKESNGYGYEIIDGYLIHYFDGYKRYECSKILIK